MSDTFSKTDALSAARHLIRNKKTIATFRSKKGLGRLPKADEGDKRHTMSARLAALGLDTGPLPDSYYWSAGAVLDQGYTSQCVAYSWTGFLLASPIKTTLASLGGNTFMSRLYSVAQRNDEWPGEDYDGTSVRAGAKVLSTPTLAPMVANTSSHIRDRYLSEYVWAWDAETARRWVLSRGPLVLGTNWYESMFAADRGGYLPIAGEIAGGHAYLVIGYSAKREAFRIVNSWGRAWGQSGRAWIHRADVDRLIHEEGEACSALELKAA